MTGYDFVADKVREYWKHEHICTVVVFMTVGNSYLEELVDRVSDSDPDTVEFQSDWWEGEDIETIKIQAIIPLWKILWEYRTQNYLYDTEVEE